MAVRGVREPPDPDSRIRYTPEGGRVTVGAERTADGVRFRVSDTGPGVPAEVHDHVFDRYWQADQPDHGGAGLGLPIAKGIVDAHRGRIWVETEEGKGTTFYFTLPIAMERDDEGSAVA